MQVLELLACLTNSKAIKSPRILYVGYFTLRVSPSGRRYANNSRTLRESFAYMGETTPVPTTERHLLQPSCSSATQWLGNLRNGLAPQDRAVSRRCA
ncbi:hypothetical protein Riv7116_4900 [Rivularia sp. PCC 7116]|nr:hypothetical protein Riv7116_4900 [Rivularia sp. PCC 7116]